MCVCVNTYIYIYICTPKYKLTLIFTEVKNGDNLNAAIYSTIHLGPTSAAPRGAQDAFCSSVLSDKSGCWIRTPVN